MSTENVVLHVADVHKSFAGLHALSDIDLSVREGETHAIIGPNGAGKSTLLNVCIGRLKPDSGHVVFDGEAAEDAGGPFRSSLTFVCDDLTSKDSGVNLLVPTRKHQYKVGVQSGKYTLIPGVPLQEAEHLEFFGKLLGVGLRHQISCPLNITSTFWKHLTGETLNMRDVQLMDENSTAVIQGLTENQEQYENMEHGNVKTCGAP